MAAHDTSHVSDLSLTASHTTKQFHSSFLLICYLIVFREHGREASERRSFLRRFITRYALWQNTSDKSKGDGNRSAKSGKNPLLVN